MASIIEINLTSTNSGSNFATIKSVSDKQDHWKEPRPLENEVRFTPLQVSGETYHSNLRSIAFPTVVYDSEDP